MIENLNHNDPSSRIRYAAIKEHLFSDINDEAVVLNTKNGKYYGIRGSGVIIWRLLSSPSTIDEIRSNLIREYDVDGEKCNDEIRKFLDQLVGEGLIEVLDDQAN
ncbi:MAG TPA: PqqD family peptide modification chaperone [Pyrinomonadaceae bacterium]|nr:PqqD family peptide modification chaperone [Pyrinomonadaceae bacterium]